MSRAHRPPLGALPPARSRRLDLAVGASLLALAACGTRPPPVPPSDLGTPAAVAPASARDDFEASLRAQAAQAAAERRWNDAALAWELVSVLRPGDAQVAERLADARQRNDAAVAEALAAARQAERRGDVDGATQRWWAVLALDPTNAVAAGALRKAEADRQRRLYLGRHAASTLTRRAVAEAEAMPPRGAAAKSSALPPAAPPAAAAPIGPEVDRAALLAADGEYEAAAEVLEARLAEDRRDVAARRLLAEVYRREADALAVTDRQKARKALDRAARLDR